MNRHQLRTEATEVLEQAWREPGFCVPNGDVYPHQWLWDSCFHAIAWGHLGSERGLVEVQSALSAQADDGFVPHMTYWHHPGLHADFWGRTVGSELSTPAASTITQPPMFGHALAALQGLGFEPPAGLVDKARAGLAHLGSRSRTPGGLVPVFHPWETGCDDSPRWDGFYPDGGPETNYEVDRDGRRDRKGQFVETMGRHRQGHGVTAGLFAVGSVGFNALVAWNAAELARAFPQPNDPMIELADELSEAVQRRWNGTTWVDDYPPATGSASGGDGPVGLDSGRAVRTLDTMMALLVDPKPGGFAALVDPSAFGAECGPRGVHRQEATYRPDRYWRGSTWPQLAYLAVVAAARANDPSEAQLAEALVRGATRSGWAEYWHPDTGEGLGARPQTWATIAVAV